VNLLNMLPVLEGYDFLYFTKAETVSKGRYELLHSKKGKGWLFSLSISTDDAYASLKMTYMGHTETRTPHFFFNLGVTLPPPSGAYLSTYLRPSVLSTAGIFTLWLVTSAYAIPVKGLVRLEVGLESGSTQATASISANFMFVNIIDEEVFIKSVRKFKYGWLGWVFGAISKIPGLKYIGIPEEIREVVGEIPNKEEEAK